MRKTVAAIVGVGPGLGTALAETFSAAGFAVALMARTTGHTGALATRLGDAAHAFTIDATDAVSVERAFGDINRHFDTAPEVLIYNAGIFAMGDVASTTPEQFERCWQLNCLGGFLASKAVLDSMIAAGRGTILLTGATASLRGGKGFSQLAVGKFGLRALSQSMARELGPQGIHVAHVIVDGKIDTPAVRAQQPDKAPDSRLSPAAIASTYLMLHRQDRSAWTQEMDLRPALEPF